MEFKVLGPLEMEAGGQSRTVAGNRQRTLLATLLVSGGRPVSAEQLYTELWGESPPSTVENSLQAHVYRLRRTLNQLAGGAEAAPALITRPSGYVLDVDPRGLDMVLFRDRVAQARLVMPQAPGKAYRYLEEALAVWRGAPLQDVVPGPMCQSVALQLDEEYLTALEDKLWLGIDSEDPVHTIGELKRMSTIHPWRERITEMLMLALYRSGRQAEAIETYNTARRRLVDELGMEPSAQLRQRFREILNQVPYAHRASPAV